MITTYQNQSFIEAEQYSDFILRILHDGLLPSNFYRNVSDFGSGTTLNIKTIGEATLQEVEEDTPVVYNPIESGNVTLQITDFPGDAWYVTDVMRQDGAQIDQLLSARAEEANRALQEYFETRALATLNAVQDPADPNAINGFAHRFVATGANATMEVQDLIDLKLSFDKAQVPYAGRIGVIDPVVEATLNAKWQGTYNVDSNQMMQEILEGGFGRDHTFVMNIFGWNLMTSNRLPAIASETVGNGSVTGGVANIFMCIIDDNCKPLMVAWRQQPRVEGDRNKDRKRDEFVLTARMGFGVQRVDTLGVILTSATATS